MSAGRRRRKTPPERAYTWRYALWFGWTALWTTTVGLVVFVVACMAALSVVSAVGGP